MNTSTGGYGRIIPLTIQRRDNTFHFMGLIWSPPYIFNEVMTSLRSTWEDSAFLEQSEYCMGLQDGVFLQKP